MHSPFAPHRPFRIVTLLLAVLALLACAVPAAPVFAASPGPAVASVAPGSALADDPPVDPNLLRNLVLGLLLSGGVASGVYWLIENIGWLAGLDPRLKRMVAPLVLSLLGVGAVVAFAVWMRWLPVPDDPQAWVNLILSYAVIALAAYYGSQAEHGLIKLKARSLDAAVTQAGPVVLKR